jgi:protein-disulfide isomerase
MHLALAILLGLAIPVFELPASADLPSSVLTPDTIVADTLLVQRAREARVFGASGNAAIVTIYEFFDYSCSTCREFHAQRGDSLKALAGPDVGLQFHNYIIARLPRGYAAAEAAACAAGLGGPEVYLDYHDRLLREPGAWRTVTGIEPFVAWADEAGLPAPAFADCLERDVPAQLILGDAQLGAAFGVRGTPTFVFVPRGAQSADEAVVFYGNEPMSRFHEAIEEVRSRAR